MNEVNIRENIVLEVVNNIENGKYIDVLELAKGVRLKTKRKIKQYNRLLLYIDVYKIKDNFLCVMKNIKILFEYCQKNNIEIGEKNGDKEILVYIKSPFDEQNEYFSNIKDFFFAISFSDLTKRLTYIYDKACDELDKKFQENNYCDFKDDRCSCQRNSKCSHETMGCCYAFYYRKDGTPICTGECPHLTPTGCNVKCLGCKIFTCRYLRKIGIKYKADDVFLLNIFLSKKQKKYVETTYFKTEKEILNHLLEIAGL